MHRPQAECQATSRLAGFPWCQGWPLPLGDGEDEDGPEVPACPPPPTAPLPAPHLVVFAVHLVHRDVALAVDLLPRGLPPLALALGRRGRCRREAPRWPPCVPCGRASTSLSPPAEPGLHPLSTPGNPPNHLPISADRSYFTEGETEAR